MSGAGTDQPAAPDFAAVFESLPGLYLLLAPDLTIIGASDEYLATTMTVRSSLVGQNLFEAFPDNPDDPGASGVSNLRASLERAITSCAPDEMALQRYDVRRPDGSGFEERYWSPINVPVVARDGTVACIIHRVEDVTDTVQLQDESDHLARTVVHGADLTRLIIERAHNAFVSMDAAGRIIEWNPSAVRIFGWDKADVVGRLVHDVVVPPRLRTAHARGLARFLETGDGPALNKTVELEGLHRDGHEFPIAITISPIQLEGEFSFHAFIQDISERRRHEVERDRHVLELADANSRLEAADRLKDQFLAMASHEMRTPLTAISGFTVTLQRMQDQLTDEQKQEFLSIIDTQTHRLQRLVDDLLTLARIESGALVARPEPVVVALALKRTVRELGAEHVRVLCAPDLTAYADPDQLQQILVNFLSNAVKYGGDPIELSGERVDTAVRIHVRDHGPGVPPEFVPHLFERFTRASSSSSGVEGTGLGLSITRGLANAQGGDAWYEPASPHGSCFVVELPTVERAEVPSPSP